MARCREIEGDDSDALETLSAMEMVNATAEGAGHGKEADDRQIAGDTAHEVRVGLRDSPGNYQPS